VPKATKDGMRYLFIETLPLFFGGVDSTLMPNFFDFSRRCNSG